MRRAPVAVTGNKAGAMRCFRGRSSPGWVFGRDPRVCAIASGTGFKSKHVQRRSEPVAYDDVRMTVWRHWM